MRDRTAPTFRLPFFFFLLLFCLQVGHAWRTGDDIQPNYASIMGEATVVSGWASVTSVAAWGDADMLGQLICTTSGGKIG